MEEYKMFRPMSIKEGQHDVVGDCNGVSMEIRWEKETPPIAEAILKYKTNTILDYGCGIGRIAKEILKQDDTVKIVGSDQSFSMLELAKKYVNNDRFSVCKPKEIEGKFDLIYCVYVLQHVPAVELRDVLERIHYHLSEDGIFIYVSACSRLAVRFDSGGFFNDSFLGVNEKEEIGKFFDTQHVLFSEEDLNKNPILKHNIYPGNNMLSHDHFVCKKKPLKGLSFNL